MVSVPSGLQGEGLHGQVLIQSSVRLDHRSRQPRDAQQARRGRLRLRRFPPANGADARRSKSVDVILNAFVRGDDVKCLVLVFSVCPSVSWTCSDSRTSRKTDWSSCASTTATRSCNITPVGTSLSLNKWVCFSYPRAACLYPSVASIFYCFGGWRTLSSSEVIT